ncbi:MAG: DUF433 domain-containing protein [Candidatus Desulfatibia sp.]|uniref:DUF433 domain-containing protein n=1 Tax=Candidatus Desulfatibia sp. TaxID=3101189 RepID=UPI002F2FADB0
MTLAIEKELVPFTVDSEGVVRIGKTRVTLDTIVTAFLEGATAEEITQQYPTLDLADVYSAIGYYLRQRPEIDDYLQEERRQAETVRKQNESRFDPHGIRDRLLARSAAKVK